MDHIFAVRTILARRREFNLDTHLVFVNFTKAYDSIDIGVMWHRLQELRVPRKIVVLMQALFKRTRSRVRVQGFLSEDFTTSKGVRQ